MAAADHLSGLQFWPIEKAGALTSQYGDMTVEQAYSGPERYGDTEQAYARSKGFSSAQEHQAALKKHISANGMQHPIDYVGEYLTNGQHRYNAARDLGWSQIPAQSWYGKTSKVEGWDK